MLQTVSAVWRIPSRQTGHWDILPPLTWQWRGGRYGVVSHNDCSFESAGTQRHHGVGCRELKTIIYQFNPRKMWQGVFMNTLFWFHFLMVKISAHISWNISVYGMSKMLLRAVSVLEDKYRNIFGKISVFDINMNIKLKRYF